MSHLQRRFGVTQFVQDPNNDVFPCASIRQRNKNSAKMCSMRAGSFDPGWNVGADEQCTCVNDTEALC